MTMGSYHKSSKPPIAEARLCGNPFATLRFAVHTLNQLLVVPEVDELVPEIDEPIGTISTELTGDRDDRIHYLHTKFCDTIVNRKKCDMS